MKHGSRLLLLVMMVVVGVGCAQAVNTAEPPKIVYGQDVCDRCSMIISEEKYAAAYWTEAGEARRFDDIGGMLAFITAEPEDVAAYWVHDFETAAWIRAEEATYVASGELVTPMGFGIVAFADEELAQAMASESETGTIYSFAELLVMNMTMPMDHTHDAEEMEHIDEGEGK
jgi:copper chaperone NosL